MSLPVYGIDKDLKRKAEEKHDPQRERQAREWIEAVTHDRFKSESFIESLKDGVLLCKLLNAISPDLVKYSLSAMPFKQMENISAFLASCERLGCPKHDLFQTVDLYEGKNLNAVIDAVFSVSRHAQKAGYNGPMIGPKLSDKHEVSFSEEQLNAGKFIPSQQSGFNKGANASGIYYGGRRDVFDPKAQVHEPLSNEPTRQTMGSAGGANQSNMGVSFAGIRQVSEGHIGEPVDNTPSMQLLGSAGGANQSNMGVSFANKRQIKDEKAEHIHHPYDEEPSRINMGSKDGANQSNVGVTFANKRQIV